MAHYFALAHNGKTKPVSKTGTKATGIHTITATWGAAIKSELYYRDGMDYYRVSLISWPSGELIRVIAEGPIVSAIGKPAGDIKPGTAPGE